MLTISSILKGWGRRIRNRAFRGPMHEVSLLRREIADMRTLIDTLQQTLQDQVRPGQLAYATLAATGTAVNVAAEERARDVTRSGTAMGYPDWESSIAAYRTAYQLAIDYLVAMRCAGPILEFGTCTGFTARQLCELMNARGFDRHLYLYDSFVGLPDMAGTPDETSYEVAHNKVWHHGAMAVPPGYENRIRESLVSIRPPDTIHIIKGYFEHTLATGLPREKCSLIHLDCDLYSSTKYVLTRLAERDLFQDGGVVLFDDWNCNRANPNMGQRRALQEFLSDQSRWSCSPWFHYGWNGMAFIIHDTSVTS